MKEEPKSLIFALDSLSKSGTVSRTHLAITSKPKGLTIEEICEISGMTRGNIEAHGIPPLVKFQIIERDKSGESVIFKFTPRWLTFLREKYALAHPT